MKQKIITWLDTAVEWAVYGLIFFIPVSIAGLNLFAAAAVAFFVLKQFLAPDYSSLRKHRSLFLILLVFFGSMALSLINSGFLFEKSLMALLFKWGRMPLILWVILDTFRDPRRVARAVWVLAGSALLVALASLSQKFLGYEFLRHNVLRGGGVSGPFKNQNGLAGYMTCVIPLVISLALWRWKQVAVRTGLALGAGILLIVSFLTFCRGGWIGLVVGMFFLVLAVNYQRIDKKIFCGLAGFYYIVCVPLFVYALYLFQDRGDSFRFILYRGAWRMIQEHPWLGKGLGTFMDHCVTYTDNFGTFYAHNCYLQIWAESGVFSLLGFLALVGYVLYQSVRVIMQVPVSLHVLILTGLTAGFFGMLAHAFFDAHLYSVQLSFLFWVVLGMTRALSVSVKQGSG